MEFTLALEFTFSSQRGDYFNGIYRSEELLQKSIKKYKIKEKV